MREQWKKIKQKYQDAIVLIRDEKSQDYYTFGNDAKNVAAVYNKVVLSDTMIISGSDIHDALPRLVKAGNKVAICDELIKETNGKAKSGRAS